jgi:hypothetical protein
MTAIFPSWSPSDVMTMCIFGAALMFALGVEAIAYEAKKRKTGRK